MNQQQRSTTKNINTRDNTELLSSTCAHTCQPLLLENVVQFTLAVEQPPRVGAVHHPDQTVGLLKVVAPVGTNRDLAADVPDVELVVLILHRLDVEPERG